MNDTRPHRTPLVPPGGVDHHVADMTTTFAADVTLEQAQAALGEHGQWLPIDGDEDLSLGQLIEQNSTGPLRLGYGAWRDLLLGVQFRDGRGQLITAGGRTVKNVAGYDLTKFMVGQRGVFGKLVTLTTRTYRRPTHALLAGFAPDIRRLDALLTMATRPQWSLIDQDRLMCGYLGDARFIELMESLLAADGSAQLTEHSVDDDIALRASLWKGAMRASVPPSRVMEFVAAAGLTGWVADPAFGIVRAPSRAHDLDRVHGAALSVGGTVTVADCDTSRVEVSTSDVERRMIERLKHAFDLENRLTPLPWRS